MILIFAIILLALLSDITKFYISIGTFLIKVVPQCPIYDAAKNEKKFFSWLLILYWIIAMAIDALFIVLFEELFGKKGEYVCIYLAFDAALVTFLAWGITDCKEMCKKRKEDNNGDRIYRYHYSSQTAIPMEDQNANDEFF